MNGPAASSRPVDGRCLPPGKAGSRQRVRTWHVVRQTGAQRRRRAGLPASCRGLGGCAGQWRAQCRDYRAGEEAAAPSFADSRPSGCRRPMPSSTPGAAHQNPPGEPHRFRQRTGMPRFRAWTPAPAQHPGIGGRCWAPAHGCQTQSGHTRIPGRRPRRGRPRSRRRSSPR